MSPARYDDELPPLPPGLSHLKGIELLRAAYELSRPASTAPRSRATPFVPLRPPGRPAVAAPVPAVPDDWTPHDAAPPELMPGHWADGIPIPDTEPPSEEDW